MLKEFAQYLVSLKENKTYDIHGDTYSDRDLVRIEPHIDRPTSISVSGLDSIVKLVRNEMDMLTNLPVFIRVDGANRVVVFTTYDDVMRRDSLYIAECDVPGFRDGFREYEQAIIELRSKFAPGPGVDYMLDLLSRISKENGVTTIDNGVSQTVEARQGVTIDPAQHITRRSYESVGKRNVNAFQFDHPELHPYYREAAEALIADADLSLQQPMGQRYERTMQGNRTIQNAQASAHLRQAMDETGLSRDAIIDAAQRIVHDQGQENTAAAKRVELILDGMLSHGWRSMDGESVGPNQAYLTARDAISGAETDQAREPLPIWDMEEPADRGRSAEELRQDIGLVRRAAAALGQNGSRALTAAYDEATARSYAPQDVAESFFQVYNAALNGEALGAEAAQKAAALPEHVRLAAESAGRKDAQRAAEVKAFGENAGLTRDAAWRQAHLCAVRHPEGTGILSAHPQSDGERGIPGHERGGEGPGGEERL